MKLSTKTRYGSRAMVEFALAYPEKAVSVKEVAAKQRLSPKYLEHIVASLKAAGLLKSVRGIHGGYALTRPPAQITLKGVFQVLEGSLAPVDCVDHAGACPIEEVCPTRETWVELKEALSGVLEGTTLRCLVENKQRKTNSTGQMYDI